MSLMIMKYNEQNNTYLHRHLQSDPCSLSEEVGETALSFLARDVSSQPSRCSFKTVERSFTRLGLIHNVLNHIHSISETKAKTNRRHVTSDDPIVQQPPSSSELQ